MHPAGEKRERCKASVKEVEGSEAMGSERFICFFC